MYLNGLIVGRFSNSTHVSTDIPALAEKQGYAAASRLNESATRLLSEKCLQVRYKQIGYQHITATHTCADDYTLENKWQEKRYFSRTIALGAIMGYQVKQ